MFTSWTSTNSALQQRISETTTAQEKLQAHMAKTNQELKDQEEEIRRIEKALRDKEAPLKVWAYTEMCTTEWLTFTIYLTYLSFVRPGYMSILYKNT